ncbi:MAG: DUF4013 domain-containing protein [Cellvibrionaceae bacterium]
MDYCKYHPLTPATYSCRVCHTYNCDSCVDESDPRKGERCFTCARPVEHLGAINQAIPFWRRLEESFRYPLATRTLVLIVAVSLLGSVLAYLPLAILWYLMVTGAFLKYCFSCLKNTASGLLVPPDITEAYSGGLALIGSLLAMLVAMGVAVFGAYQYFGPQIAGLLGFLIILALPAVVILFGMTDSVAEALNPLNLLRLIAAVGLPYGLILGFVLMMSASVSVINELIGHSYSMVSNVLQSMVANYYTIVMFHIMGYMIFQYQGELGFTAREDSGESDAPRSERDHMAARIDIRLKEGDYNGLVELFDVALAKFPADKEFHKQRFEFFYATGRKELTEEAANRYLDFLLRSQQDYQLTTIYKRVLALSAGYQPASAKVRHELALACKNRGDSLSAIKLINGMHKQFPDYPQLPEAFELMADALEDIPNKAEQAQKCRQLANSLAERRPTEKQSKKAKRPVFGAKKPTKPDPDPESSQEPETEGPQELTPIEFK